MNKLKDLHLKFSVENNPDLSEAIQRRVLVLGGGWHNQTGEPGCLDQPYLFLDDGCLRYTLEKTYFMKHPNRLSTLDDLYHLPELWHTVTLDGKQFKVISEDLFQKVKNILEQPEQERRLNYEYF